MLKIDFLTVAMHPILYVIQNLLYSFIWNSFTILNLLKHT